MSVERIQQVYEPTDTAKTLAAKLNMSRNAVIGYYNRNPTMRETHPLSGNKPSAKTLQARKDGAKGFDHIARNARVREKRRMRNEANERLRTVLSAQRGKYNLADLPSGCCKWPIGDDTANMMYCGEVRDANHHAYCTHHKQQSIQPHDKDRKR